MNDKVLFVDDECNILYAYERQLRNKFNVATAVGGERALLSIAAEGPFSVIVSDMRMADMDGVQFLTRVRQIAPDSVRVMLTGCADLETAVNAVNEGNIFRFLTKPCATGTLEKALQASIAQYRLIMAERELLEKTLKQSVKVLLEILGLINPIAFSRASSLQHVVRHLAIQLQLRDTWQFELAAMLSQIGCIGILPETLERVYAGQELSPDEQERFAKHPAVACNLIGNIHRLEPIAQMIVRQQEPIGPVAPAAPPKERDVVVVGGQILKVALEFDRLLKSGASVEMAIMTIEKQPAEYDPMIVSALGNIEMPDIEMETRVIGIDEMVAPMIADEEVRTNNGLLLMTKGQKITYGLLVRLRSFGRNNAIPSRLRVRVPRHNQPAGSPA